MKEAKAINPVLFYAIGLATTFVVAAMTQLLVEPEMVLASQVPIGIAILLGFFIATCLSQKYLQLIGWGVMSFAAGIRFSVFFSLMRGDVYAEPNPMFTVIVLMLWAFGMAWKTFRVAQKTDTWRVTWAVLGQIIVSIIAQVGLFILSR